MEKRPHRISLRGRFFGAGLTMGAVALDDFSGLEIVSDKLARIV